MTLTAGTSALRAAPVSGDGRIVDVRDETVARAAAVRATLGRARGHLLSRQDPAGWWKGELATNVTMEAEDLLVRHALGVLRADQLEETARWIRSQQLADGSWELWPGAGGDLSTTVEAHVALRLAGDDATAPHLQRSAAFVRDRGGPDATRVFTRVWLALVGLGSWHDVPVTPPELVLLPKRFPLALPQWACWARQTLVPITVVGALRPVYPVGFAIPELSPSTPAPDKPVDLVGRAFLHLDKVLRLHEKRPIAPLRRLALRRAESWILDRQEADGSWGGIQPPWVYSLLALRLLGHGLDDPAVTRGLEGLERFTIREQTPDGWVRRLEACQSPVWDTALALVALRDAAVDTDDPAVTRAAGWLLGEEVRVRGDWTSTRSSLAPGGWSFEFDNDLYPDVDDTAEVALALQGLEIPGAEAAVQRGLAWVRGMQCRDGGWAAFDADQFGTWPNRLPFCDFGKVTDPPSADVTAHAVEALARCGGRDTEPVRRGVRWLLDAQEPDGSWFGRWGVNHVYGTGAVLPALVEAGEPAESPALQAGIRWLLIHQNPDGGWGETVASYVDPAQVGNGPSTPSQTAWALLGLLAAGGPADAVAAGLDWLVAAQRADGGWDEPWHTGTGFPGDFSISYELYRLSFPISALGRWLRSQR